MQDRRAVGSFRRRREAEKRFGPEVLQHRFPGWRARVVELVEDHLVERGGVERREAARVQGCDGREDVRSCDRPVATGELLPEAAVAEGKPGCPKPEESEGGSGLGGLAGGLGKVMGGFGGLLGGKDKKKQTPPDGCQP